MALINNLYVWVEDESLQRGVEAPEHPVEEGIDLTDNVKRKACVLSLKGEIVGKDFSSTLAKLNEIHNKGVIVSYIGRNIFSNALITSFNTGHPNTIMGGCSFDMEIREIRISKSSYNPTKKKTTATKAKTSSSTKQTTKKTTTKTTTSTKVYHKVKKGDTVWALVAAKNAPYKKYGKSCDWVLKNNPSAFSRKNDFGTLKIGAKLWVGNK